MKGNKLQISFLVVCIALCIFLGLIAISYVFQHRLIYFPIAEISHTPQSINLSYESVTFETSDGIALSGWFIPAEQERGVVLFCHGNTGNISHCLESIRIFNQLGLNTFIFDYRGYGQSQGKPGEQGTFLDAEAAWYYLVQKRRIPEDKIIILGRSLGGAVAAHLARDHAGKALILESTFTSVRDMAALLYPYLPSRFLLRVHYPTESFIGKVNSPVLIIHSQDDELVPFDHGRRLFEAAGEPKTFLEISGGHNNGFIISKQKYEQGLDDFIFNLSTTGK